MMKKTKYWQVPEVHFSTIQEKRKKENKTKSRKLIHYTELCPTMPYLLRRIG